jgi:hypothetical protein
MNQNQISSGDDMNFTGQPSDDLNQSKDTIPSLPTAVIKESSSGRDSLSSMNKINDLTKNFIEEYKQGILYQEKPVVSPIEVDELASKLAQAYEKLRRIVDWKEENLIRRTAIERILKRTLLSEISGIGQSSLNADKITGPLVLEMIRSGYFSNAQISKNKIPVAKQSLAKYIYILNNSPHARRVGKSKKQKFNIKEKVNFYNWILEIAACEIEEILAPAFKENALINYMTLSIYSKLKVIPQRLITDEEVLIQTYIAVHRSLYTLDAPIITYNLFKYRYARWFEDDPQFIKSFTQNINQIQEQIDADLEHKYGKEFFKICERLDAAYLIFGDVMKEVEDDPKQIEPKLMDKKNLSNTITKVYNRRLSTLKSRLYRSAVYSTLSIFVAGLTSLVIIEGPVAKLLADGFSWFAVFVDLAVPSSLMFILVVTIKPPKKENLERIKQEIYKIVYFNTESDEYEINLVGKRNKFLHTIFSIVSLIGGIIGAYAVFSIFRLAGIPWTSIYIDTIYVALVIFAATVIRHKSQELTIQESGGLLSMIIDFFYLPLARVGQWLSVKWKEYNIVSVFLTALVDTPFSVILGLIEDWRSFLRDRRSEIH